MNELDIKPNSNAYKERQKKAKEEKKPLEKVVQGPVKVKKKSGFHKFTDVFVSEDAGSVKSYILSDVVIPAAKQLISDIVTDGIGMLLYGESGRRSSKSSNAGRVSYRNFYDKRDDGRSRGSVRARTSYSYDDIVLATRGEAEDVLARMDELLDTYGVATVADLCDLVGITGEYTDNRYGWTNLRNADVVHVRDGYLLKMPRALPID
jgi:hypothetical protein